jgi:TonB family protein
MRALNKPPKVLPRQWIKSALLHGFLLLCLAVYHWHGYGSLSFETKGFNKKSTVDPTTSSIHNSHFVEMFFEQSKIIESHSNAAEGTEVSSDTKAEIATGVATDTKTGVATDTKIVIKQDMQAEVQTNVQHDKPVRLPQKRTQSAAQASASVSRTVNQAVSQAEAKPLQTARPDHAHSPKPAYPLALRDLGVSGVVWLRVWVDKNGRPREVELAKGSGYRLFDEAALRAVQHWHFIPAKNEHQNLASWVEFAVRFEING